MAARMLVSEHGTVCWKCACYGKNISVGGIESLARLAHFIGNKPNIRGSPGDESYNQLLCQCGSGYLKRGYHSKPALRPTRCNVN